jgi:hypothetical protein
VVDPLIAEEPREYAAVGSEAREKTRPSAVRPARATPAWSAMRETLRWWLESSLLDSLAAPRTAWSEGLHGVLHLEQRMDLGISGRRTRGSGGTRERRGERRGMALGFGGARV